MTFTLVLPPLVKTRGRLIIEDNKVLSLTLLIYLLIKVVFI